MTSPGAGPREQALDLVADGVPVRAGFRILQAGALAGGPIELEFFVEVRGDAVRYLSLSGDRMRLRPADFSFTAAFAGVPLADPCEGLPDYGGLGWVADVAPDHPLRFWLVLNEYVRLEAVLDLLPPGAAGLLSVVCRRPLRLGADVDAAMAARGEPVLVEVELGIELRRDDAALDELVARLVAEVRDGPPTLRERPLSILLALRGPAAVARWRALVTHPDALVADRVRQTLAQLPVRQP